MVVITITSIMVATTITNTVHDLCHPTFLIKSIGGLRFKPLTSTAYLFITWWSSLSSSFWHLYHSRREGKKEGMAIYIRGLHQVIIIITI